jgi:hypothetical protein
MESLPDEKLTQRRQGAKIGQRTNSRWRTELCHAATFNRARHHKGCPATPRIAPPTLLVSLSHLHLRAFAVLRENVQGRQSSSGVSFNISLTSSITLTFSA